LTFPKRLQAEPGAAVRWEVLELGLLPPLASRFLNGSGKDLQLPWDAATCVWAAAMQEGFSVELCYLQQARHYDLEIHRYSSK
jgi:hypothetical protein